MKCVQVGLPTTLRLGLVAGYDGANAWTVEASEVGESQEQFTVELHEYLHHELQLSSGWGLVSGMAMLLSRNGWRSYALAELFETMVDVARETHEVFATTLSATVFGVEDSARFLAGNSVYTRFLDRGLALVDPDMAGSWRLRHSAITAVLQVCMRPRGVFELLERGFGELRHTDLDLRRDAPDRRLAAFEQVGGPGSWQSIFEELRSEFPEETSDAFYESSKSQEEGSPDYQRLRVFEEEVLNPRCHAHVRRVIGTAGLESIGTREQSRLAEMLHMAVAAVDPTLADQLKLVRERLPISEEASAYARQRIRLRDPFEAGFDATEPIAADAPYVCGLWLDRDIVREQFAVTDELPELVVALHEPRSATARVELSLLPEETAPQVIQQALGRVPLLVLTTHRTLARHAKALSTLQRIEPVYVLMDLPIARHMGHWIAQGATVRCALTTPEVQIQATLAVAVFMIGQQHPLVFFTIGGESATYMLVKQLQQRHPDNLLLDQDMLNAMGGGLRLAVEHVLKYWHVLGQLK